jgi:hypothetical protein
MTLSLSGSLTAVYNFTELSLYSSWYLYYSADGVLLYVKKPQLNQ